eukprot:PITA_36516
MMEKYQSIMKNDVWEIVSRPKGKSVVTSKRIYKMKHIVDGSIEKYKARFVAREFSQKEGEDYEETFAPVTRYTFIRTIISIASIMGWKLHQMDVKTAFLNGVIEEEVYIKKPQGFEVHGKKCHVYKLKKALYGPKQAPRAWYSRIDGYLMSLGFTKSDVDPNLYYKVVKVNTLSEFMVEPRHEYWIAVKHVLRYLCGTVSYGLRYVSNGEVQLQGYTNSDWERSAKDRKSTSRCCFSLGSAMISWMSKKQTFVTLSTVEVEYNAASLASCEAMWL